MFLLWDSFEAKAGGHGGNHRSAQVAELCSQAGVVAKKFPDDSWGWRELGMSLRRSPSIYSALPPGFRSARNLALALRQLAIMQKQGVTGIVCEKCYWSPWIVALAQKYPTVCVPHNIESLVPGQVNALRKEDWADVGQELRLLARLGDCFCICSEDAAIVQAVAKDVHVLPYFPCQQYYKQLVRIRAAREKDCGQKQTILMLGSAGNPPTLAGMRTCLESLETRSEQERARVVVAGVGTEVLQDRYGHVCRILGRVSSEKLESLLISAKCVLVNHALTSGCLTRVIDAVVAGIPVVCNLPAVRGHAGVEGIARFDRVEDCIESALCSQFETPPLPSRPREAEEHFKTVLERYARSS